MVSDFMQGLSEFFPPALVEFDDLLAIIVDDDAGCDDGSNNNGDRFGRHGFPLSNYYWLLGSMSLWTSD